MTLRSHVKRNARRSLEGSWGRAIGILFICATITFILGLLRGMTALLGDIPEFRDILGTPGYFLDDAPVLTAASFAMETAFLLVSLVVGAPLALGVRNWYYELGGGTPQDVSAVFGFFGGARLFFRALWLRVNLWVRLLFWAAVYAAVPAAVYVAALAAPSPGAKALLTVLGVLLLLLALVFYGIAMNRYFLAPYLASAYPEKKARWAIQRSVREMRGGRTEIFLLQLSFLPWVLLCAFLLPILYVGPYYGASGALYARYFIERARRAGTLPEQAAVEEPLQRGTPPGVETQAGAPGQAQEVQEGQAQEENHTESEKDLPQQ